MFFSPRFAVSQFVGCIQAHGLFQGPKWDSLAYGAGLSVYVISLFSAAPVAKQPAALELSFPVILN